MIEKDAKKTLQERIKSATKKSLKERIGAALTDGSTASSNGDASSPSKFQLSVGSMTRAIQDMLQISRQQTQLLISGEHVLLVLLLSLTFLVRFLNLTFNTLHLDEAIYVTVGEEALSGVYLQGASTWMFGSYLYPLLSAAVNGVGGVFAMRLSSALLSTGAAYFVFLTTLRLFGRRAALWALLVFSLTGVSINLGQHATYDALSVPFVSASLYCVVSAMKAPKKQGRFLRWGAITFSLSVLAKYIALLTLPALLLVMPLLHFHHQRGFFSFLRDIRWQEFATPIVLILGIYSAYYHNDLYQVASSRFAFQSATRQEILVGTLQHIGLPLIPAAAGALIIIRNWQQRFRRENVMRFFLLMLGLAALGTASIMLPLYQLADVNIRSLWKHNVFALVFVAPMAGYGVEQVERNLYAAFRYRSPKLRTVGASLTALCIFGFVSYGLRQNKDFQQSWPNNEQVLTFIRAQEINENSRVLSSSYAIYEYYLDLGVNDRSIWKNIWYDEYEDVVGEEGVARAIEDCAYTMVILDSYYEPEKARTLGPLLKSVGYRAAFETYQRLSNDGVIHTIVYLPRNVGCGKSEL